MWCVQLRRAQRHAACHHEGHGDMLCAAMKGTAMCYVPPRRARRLAACCCKGCGNVLYATVKGMAMCCVQLRGHSNVGCVSIVMVFHPRCCHQ